MRMVFISRRTSQSQVRFLALNYTNLTSPNILLLPSQKRISQTLVCRSSNLTIEGLASAVVSKFNSLKHEPIWKQERPKSMRGDELRLYKIYPVGLTQKQALYTFKFKGDSDLRRHVEDNPCAKFEVIFVQNEVCFYFMFDLNRLPQKPLYMFF